MAILDDALLEHDFALEATETKARTTERWRQQGRWWSKLQTHPEATLHRHIAPGSFAMYGFTDEDEEYTIAPGISLHYSVAYSHCDVGVFVTDKSDPVIIEKVMRDRNPWEEAAISALRAKRPEIDSAFGEVLHWSSGMIYSYVLGGFANPESEWNAIIHQQVQAMNRLHAALLPHLDRIPELAHSQSRR